MRVVFFGSPEAALPSFAALLEAGHAVPLAVTQPDRPAGRGKRLTAPAVKTFAVERSIPVLQTEHIRKDTAAFEAIRAARPDIHVVVAYGQIIPRSIIDLPAHRSINVHFSLLPRYRGAGPVAWALFNGETRTGITVFRLNEKMDEGDILSACETEIRPYENAGELEERLSRLGAGLLLDTLDRIETIIPVPQDHGQATLAPKIAKEAGVIDWSADAARVDRHVRAFTPRPSAFALFKGQRLIIIRGTAMPMAGAGGRPGEVAAVGRAGIDVVCGGGTLYRIQRVQPENKPAMDAHAFSQNGRVRLADVLKGKESDDHSSSR